MIINSDWFWFMLLWVDIDLQYSSQFWSPKVTQICSTPRPAVGVFVSTIVPTSLSTTIVLLIPHPIPAVTGVIVMVLLWGLVIAKIWRDRELLEVPTWTGGSGRAVVAGVRESGDWCVGDGGCGREMCWTIRLEQNWHGEMNSKWMITELLCVSAWPSRSSSCYDWINDAAQEHWYQHPKWDWHTTILVWKSSISIHY